jgi:hypothetical protein
MNDAPAHLRSSYVMLKSAFPDPIERDDYLNLLFLLHDEFSQRNLAELVAQCFAVNYHSALNDVLFVGSPDYEPDLKAKERIKGRLLAHGYEAWLKEE